MQLPSKILNATEKGPSRLCISSYDWLNGGSDFKAVEKPSWRSLSLESNVEPVAINACKLMTDLDKKEKHYILESY